MSTTTILVILVFLVVCASAALQLATYWALRSLVAERKTEREAFEKAMASGQVVELPVRPGAEKYMEPTTEALKIVGDHPQPPFPAPKVGEETLMQWMIRSYNSDGIWARFVDHFYARAASHHKVRPLFEGKDLADIKRKFLATLLIMCDKGVNERAAATLVELHLHLNMSVETYDATMEALELTLLEFHVPEETIAQFVPMIDYFRDEMTVA